MRRELASKQGVQRRAELAVELLGLELRVDGLSLVLARLRALRVGARAGPLDHCLERVFELNPVAFGGENVGDLCSYSAGQMKAKSIRATL